MSAFIKISSLLAVCCCTLLSCSSETVDSQPSNFEDFPPTSVNNILLDPTAPSTPFADGDPLIVSFPDSDLVVEYASANVPTRVGADYLHTQWQYMQDCLQVPYVAPRLIVLDGWIPTQDVDDVLFSIEGRRIATAAYNPGAVSVIRISSYDFDGSQGNPGFHLRSILGRYLWTMNELPIRAYNTSCASS